MKDEFGLFMKALTFAAHKHRDQRRKDERRLPYINHPIEVADILFHTGGIDDPITLSAALLHDTIEDTDATAKEIEGIFGAEVSALVQELTDNKCLPKMVRKHLQVRHATERSLRARCIILADKICNIRDLGLYQLPGWSVQRKLDYFQWARSVVDQIRGTNDPMETLFDQLYAKGTS